MTSLTYVCSKAECPIAATGKCLELHEPADCPNATASAVAPIEEESNLPRTEPARVFIPATELGLKDALAISQGNYAHVIAILGATDAGKTCMLSALYLLASHCGLAPRFLFAGSLTLTGFELRTRRLRKWQNGMLPAQLADHTSHSDPRNPGLLHLALSDSVQKRRIELLLTDLPGEWTTDLIKRAQNAERFEFLQRADGVIIAVDTNKLHDAGKKQAELLSLEILIDRLADSVNLDRQIPIYFVACKSDSLGVDVPAELNRVISHANQRGFTANAIVVASFSQNPNAVANGYGIQSLIEAIVDYKPTIRVLPSQNGLEPKRSFGSSLGTR